MGVHFARPRPKVCSDAPASRWAGIRLACTLLLASACQPELSDEAVLVHYSGASFAILSLSGDEFRAPHLSSYVEIVPAVGTPFTVGSQSADTVQWSRHHIVVKVPARLRPLRARVHTTGGWSPTAAIVREYDADFFSTVDAAGLPTTLMGDPLGRIWVTSEFHATLAAWHPADATVHALAAYPRPVVPMNQFCMDGRCGVATGAIVGEAITLDSGGRVWFAEGGAEPLPVPVHPNHSRIIAVDGSSDVTHSRTAVWLYNIPGDRNAVIGVAWDDARQRIWFSQTGTLGSGKLVSFDPHGIPHDDFDFDWTTTAVCTIVPGQQTGTCSNASWHACEAKDDCVLAEQICPPGIVDDSRCYHEYPVPAYQPAGIAVHPDGSIWYANFFHGSDLGRLDPATGRIAQFPLAPAPDGYGVAWPWQVRIAPNGDVWATEFSTDRLASVRRDRQRDDCDSLLDRTGQTSCQPAPDGYRSPSCVNPCVQEYDVPGAWVKGADGKWSSPIETVWFDFGPDGQVMFDNGYRLPNGQWVFWPRLMEMFPSPSGASVPNAGKGVYVAPDGAVWLTDFVGKRLLRLTPRSDPLEVPLRRSSASCGPLRPATHS